MSEEEVVVEDPDVEPDIDSGEEGGEAPEPEVDFDSEIDVSHIDQAVQSFQRQPQQFQQPYQQPYQQHPYQQQQGFRPPMMPGLPTEQEFASDYASSVQRLIAAAQAPLLSKMMQLEGSLRMGTQQSFQQRQESLDRSAHNAASSVKRAYQTTAGRYKAFRTNDKFRNEVNGFVSAYLQQAYNSGDEQVLEDIARDPDRFISQVIGIKAVNLRINPDFVPPRPVGVRGGQQVGAQGVQPKLGKFGLPENVYNHLKQLGWSEDKIKSFSESEHAKQVKAGA